MGGTSRLHRFAEELGAARSLKFRASDLIKMPRYLFTHGKGYKFIRAVPQDLRAIYGLVNFAHYLKPMPRADAEAEARKLAVFADETIVTLRRHLTPREAEAVVSAGGLQEWWRSPETHMEKLQQLVRDFDFNADPAFYVNAEGNIEPGLGVDLNDDLRAFRAGRALKRVAELMGCQSKDSGEHLGKVSAVCGGQAALPRPDSWRTHDCEACYEALCCYRWDNCCSIRRGGGRLRPIWVRSKLWWR